MTDLVRAFLQIALLRRGPQDLPASALLLGVTVLGYFLVNSVVCTLLPPHPQWFLQLLVDIPFMLAWYAVLLRAVNRPERLLQTATAVFGYQAVLSPLLIASGWLLRRFAEDSVWQLPVAVFSLGMLVWMIAAGQHVVKAALEWAMPLCVVLIILQLLTEQLLLLAMFPAKS